MTQQAAEEEITLVVNDNDSGVVAVEDQQHSEQQKQLTAIDNYSLNNNDQNLIGFKPITLDSNLRYRNKKFKAELNGDFLILRNLEGKKSNDNLVPLLTIEMESIFAVHKKTDQPLVFVVFTFRAKDCKKIVYEFEALGNEECAEWVDSIRSNAFKTNLIMSGSKSFGNRRVLLFINPFSGKKTGTKIFEKQIKPMLDVAHLSYDAIITERADHAFEFCSTSDKILEYTDICGMGGDGIIYEIINGIGKRKDWKNVFDRVRIGHIPGGTSNALAVFSGSQVKSGKPAVPEMAAFIIARGFHQPMDLLSCFQEANKRYISFLSITWSAIADVDIGTENMRWLGAARNTVGAIKQIMNKKAYRGKLKYVQQSQELKRVKSLKNIRENEQRYSSYTESSIEFLQGKENEKGQLSCPLLEQYFHEEFKKLAPEYCSEKEPNITEDSTNSHLEVKEIEDRFCMFLAANISHISFDFIASPMAHHHDGYIDLVYVKDDISRGDFLNIFLAAEKGDHIFEKCVDLSKVKAFMLTPIDTGSFVVVDGEAVDYSPILVEVHPSCCKLLTL
ncbi:predicted protein [Naegleria gruberi]|uniref:Predicted protein n=1 Tax=Naegleria gruberi TaxID=5762 RepID=D2VLL2_NAEGR|nr:uncharacterized protein NAEGRDRAFT_69820 [Naegleria gruberi]EFC42329.1 predicted protein [Naegleria gruberi]|eukprot:XP_002675073.1 predicted protein [Naegleria gruberi strain NEG-M]